jgi:hypothetical protein
MQELVTILDHPSRPAQERGHLRMTATVWCRWYYLQPDLICIDMFLIYSCINI